MEASVEDVLGGVRGGALWCGVTSRGGEVDSPSELRLEVEPQPDAGASDTCNCGTRPRVF